MLQDRAKSLLIVLALLLTLSHIPPARCAPPPDAMLREDPRLEKRITLTEPRAWYVGELLERLSTLSGISLSASDRDRAAGKQVTVSLQGVPLSVVMESLWSLLSYRGATWAWERMGDGKKEPFRYELRRPKAAQKFSDRLQGQIQQDFEDQATRLLNGLDSTPEQLKELENRDPTAALYLQDDPTRQGLRAFATSFSPEEQKSILRQQNAPLLSVSQLSPEGQAMVQSEVSRQKTGIIGLNPGEAPTFVRFSTEVFPGTIMPQLMITLGNGKLMSGGGYVGGTRPEDVWRQKVADLWMLPGDATTDTVAASPVAPLVGPPAPSDATPSFPRELMTIAERVPVSFLAVVPQASVEVTPDGNTLKAYLEALKDRNIRHKWRSHVLLVCDQAWVVRGSQGTEVPWNLVKQLRQEEGTPPLLLPLATLASMTSLLSESQLKWLWLEFPVMGMVADWPEVFALFTRSPSKASRLVSDRGLPMADVPPTLRAKLGVSETPGSPMRGALRLREYSEPGKEPVRYLQFQILDSKGSPLGQQTFGYSAKPPQPEKQDTR